MARFSMEEADNYGGNGGGAFFSLKNDKDTARVRFLYNTIEDVEGYVVHEIEVDGKRRYVSCLRNYNDLIDKCPFCQQSMKQIPKLFIKLYNEDAGECQIWERSKAYFQKLGGLASRYNPLVNEIVEIERNGKPNDKKTDYLFYPIENSAVDLKDYECSEPLGTIILDKTYDEMDEFLSTGRFPGDSETVSNTRSNSNERTSDGSVRRTPTSSRRAF